MSIFISQEKIKDEVTILGKLPSYIKKQLEDTFGEQVSEKTLKDEQLEGNEDIFDAFNEVLPNELIQKNIKVLVTKRSNLYEALLHFSTLMDKRSNTWEVNGDEIYKEEAMATINTLSGARFNQSLFLGRGNAGHVFLAPEISGGFCIKYLHNPLKQTSTIEGEFSTLSSVNLVAKTFEALSVPQAHCIAKNIEGTKNFFTMERVTGLTLEQLVDFPSKRQSEYPGFTTEKIIEILENRALREALVRDIGRIHSAGIIHGDIHPRNIMLASDGTIFLIDFGNAVIPVNVSTQATYENIESVKELDIKTFINSIEKTIRLLKEQMLTK